MPTYAKKTCHSCGIRLPQPEMLRKSIRVVIGTSKKTLSGREVIFSILGSDKAKKSIARTFTSPNKREYARNKEVWECHKCAGVEVEIGKKSSSLMSDSRTEKNQKLSAESTIQKKQDGREVLVSQDPLVAESISKVRSARLLIRISILACILAPILASRNTEGSSGPFLGIGILVCFISGIAGALRLSDALRYGNALRIFIVILICLFPFSLLVLFVLNSKASSMLRIAESDG